MTHRMIISNFLLPLPFLFAFTGIAAQPYRPFPEANIVWRQQDQGLCFGCCCCGGICVREAEYHYYLNGDTVIGGIVRRKLYRTGHDITRISGPPTCPPWCNGNPQYTYFDSEYAGAIWQDTMLRKVFIDYELLYDFNLGVGDTLPQSRINSFGQNIITSIDSVGVGGRYHRRFWISVPGGSEYGRDSAYVALIEGIGSTFGLLSYLAPVFESGQTLLCVVKDSITIYPDTVSYCDMTSFVGKTELQPIIRAYPNPFHASATVHLPAPAAVLLLYDLSGRLVRREDNLHGPSFTLERGSLPPAMYFLELHAGGEVRRGKVVVE